MTTTPPPNPPTNKSPGVKSNQSYAWLLYAGIALLVLFGVIFLIKSTKTSADSKTEDSSSSKVTTVATVERVEPIPYDINDQGWTKVEIPYGVRKISFRYASTPYCAKNSIEEHCSDDTEDISGFFGEENSTNHLTYYFKTQKGSGKITVELTHY